MVRRQGAWHPCHWKTERVRFLDIRSSQRRSDEEHEERLEETEKTRLRSLAATLNYISLDRSVVQNAATEMCTKMANQTRGLQILGSEEGDVGDAGAETRRRDCGCAHGFRLGKGS